MKIIFLYLIILNSVSVVIAQQYEDKSIINHLSIKNQFLLPPDFDDKTIIKKCDSIIYCFKYERKSFLPTENITILAVNKTEYKRINFQLPEEDWIYDFFVNQNQILILASKKVLIFEKDDSTLKLLQVIKLNLNFHRMIVESDKIVLLKSCFSCNEAGIKTIIINPGNNEFQLKEFDLPVGFQLSYYYPNNWIDFKNAQFLISDILKYRMTIFNSFFQKIDSLSRKMDFFEPTSTNPALLSKKLYSDWKNEFKYSEELNRTNKIELVNFLNDSTIIICYSNNKNKLFNEKFFYDFWKYNNLINEWEIKEQNLSNTINNMADSNITLEKLVGGLVNNYQISEGSIFIIRRCSINYKDIDFEKSSKAEIINKNKEILKETGSNYSIFEFMLKKP